MRVARRVTEQPDGSDAGFTLAEVLVAVALLSLLSLLLLGALRFGLKAWERAEAHVERVDHPLMAQNFLRRVIEDAYPYFSMPEPMRGQVDFEGTPRSLRLLASAPRALGNAGRYRYALSAETRADGLDLIVTISPELAGDTVNTTRKVLLAKVASVELSYFGKSRSGRQADWHERWNGEAALPQLISIDVRFPRGDSRRWPKLVVAPSIAADVGCVYDPLTKRCRGR